MTLTAPAASTGAWARFRDWWAAAPAEPHPDELIGRIEFEEDARDE
jgi:hypothetical protein